MVSHLNLHFKDHESLKVKCILKCVFLKELYKFILSCTQPQKDYLVEHRKGLQPGPKYS